MSEEKLALIGKELRSGKAGDALQAAEEYLQAIGPGKEAGIEIAKTVASVYRELITPPVEEFVSQAEQRLPAPVGPLIVKAISRLFKINEEWEQRLWDVHRERLCRELRDWIRMRQIAPSAANISRLMALVPDNKRDQRAKYIGNVLGTVVNNQREAAQVVAKIHKAPGSFMMTEHEAHLIDEARQKRAGELQNVDIENLENQWRDTLNSACMDIQKLLPDSMAMDEPGEALLRDVGDAFRSILRVPIQREQLDLFMDATNILLDFTPKQETQTSKMARVIGRTYNNLGHTAQKAVQLSLMEIGKNQFFTNLYKGWAEEYVGAQELGAIIEVMGAFRTADFAPFIKRVAADKSTGASSVMSQSVSSALGSIAGEEATDELMTELRGIFHKKRMDLGDMKRAERLIDGLGNVIKSARTDKQERKKIREFLRSHVPEDMIGLTCHAAQKCFVPKMDEENPDFRRFAIRALVKGIWQSDERTAHHKGGDTDSPLGFREEIIGGLEKIARHDIQTLVQSMETLSARYGAAYMAAAELLERLRDPGTLPLLERMLNTTQLHDDSDNNIYQQESYWDPAQQQHLPLTKDVVIEPIIHAIGKIGGPKASEILKRYEAQIKSGRIQAPTENVARFLDQFKETGGLSDGEELEPDDENAAVARNDPATIKKLIKALKSRYLFSGRNTRRMKKVQALTQLAQITPMDAVDAVFDQLADKDMMVVSAAISCLSEYASESKPDPLKNLTINTTLEKMESRDPAVRQGAVKLLKSIGPNRKDVKPKISQFAKHTEKHEAREAIAQALKSGKGAENPIDQLANMVSAKGVPDSMQQLELKQQYLQARKAWIDGGKKGDPPQKPEGLD